MSIKLFKIDPDRWLTWLAPLVRPVWNRWGVLLWLAVVLPAAVLAASHWEELSVNLSDRLIAADNLPLLYAVFAIIKAFHELGHALAIKIRGGEVHELGLMALVFFPVPYVDASAATALRSKWERALIGAAGMLVELFIAALAMYLWALLEPGLARSLLFNVMAVAGVSTLIFNGNPLLRYDGYYILADLLEIPNLAARSMRYYGYLFERYLFGVRDSTFPDVSRGERAAYLLYGPLSFVYRTLISIGIVLFIAGQYFVIGVILALWAAVAMLVVPVVRLVRYLATNARLDRRRARVHAVVLAIIVVVVGVIGYWPLPFRTQTEGVVWLPEEAMVRAGTSGFMTRFLVSPGTRVKQGDLLVESADPDLTAERAAAQARLAELKASYDAYFIEDRVQASVVRQQIEHAWTALTRLDERAERLVAKSPATGTFLVAKASDLEGRFLRQGELIGYVVGSVKPVIRAVVAQENINLVRTATRRVAVRSSQHVDQVIDGALVREVPGGTAELPNPALGSAGGGRIAVDPRDPEGLTALERFFQFDIAVDLADSRDLIGARVHVRFDHPKEPLGAQWYRRIRQLFLTRFNV